MFGSDLFTTLGISAPVGLPASPHRFPDGAHYRVEIPSVEGPEVFEAVMDEASRRGVRVQRVSQGSGVGLLSREERSAWARAAADSGTEVSLYVRPTSSWGTGASWKSSTGAPLAGQAHGVGQLGAALDQVRQAADSGFRSVLITDIGVLAGVRQLKHSGELPDSLQVKAGVQMAIANPLAAAVVADLGASTINVPGDCTLADLAAIRQVVDKPIDIYLESPDDLGGFIRTHEIADIISVAAPVYLKFGLRNAPGLYPSGSHLQATAVGLGRERVRRAAMALEALAGLETGLIESTEPVGLAIPQP